MKILVMDQFAGTSPYWLQENPILFEELCKAALENVKPTDWRPSKILEVDENYKTQIPLCTTAYRDRGDGYTECWCYNWDSSG